MNHYSRLAGMIALSFVAMFMLMYSMVDRVANVYPNLNQFYMAGLMSAPMVVIELLLMGAMYRNRTVNIVIGGTAVLVAIALFVAIRQQAAIHDRQFLKSMIPHHAGAMLMCERASIEDAEIQQLCKTILTSQQGEIDQMKAILNRIDNEQ